MSSDFARNQWYVAAYSDEVGEDLLARTVLGEAIVFYRTSAGQVVGLSDNCVHRRFPLSEGRRVEDRIVCGYHGFTYEPTGICSRVPGQSRIPRTARVPAYRVHEQDSFVWVWIGDPSLADENLIPAAPWFIQDNWATIHGLVHLGARYGLLLDNLMDLSHEAFLHGTSIGSPEVAEVPITTEVDDENQVVHVSRHMDDSECPPLFARFMGITGRITRWQDIAYYPPGFYELHSRIAPQGHYPPADGPDDGAFHLEIFNAITPETETTTLHFWGVARDFAAKNPDTLIVVTGDHTHGVSIIGTVDDEKPGQDMREKVGTYDKAGFPNYVDADGDGYPDRVDVSRRLFLAANNGPDHYETFRPKLDGPFVPAIQNEDKTYIANEAYKNVPGAVLVGGNIPRNGDTGVHAIDDVVLQATGPGAEAFKGYMEQSDVYRVLADVLALGIKQVE